MDHPRLELALNAMAVGLIGGAASCVGVYREQRHDAADDDLDTWTRGFPFTSLEGSRWGIGIHPSAGLVLNPLLYAALFLAIALTRRSLRRAPASAQAARSRRGGSARA